MTHTQESTPPASQSDDGLQSRVLTYGMILPSDEALVEAMWLHLRAYVTPPPFHHNKEGWRTICRMLLVKAEPIITAREAAAEAKGKREGIEEAYQAVLKTERCGQALRAIRALAEKQP